MELKPIHCIELKLSSLIQTDFSFLIHLFHGIGAAKVESQKIKQILKNLAKTKAPNRTSLKAKQTEQTKKLQQLMFQVQFKTSLFKMPKTEM